MELTPSALWQQVHPNASVPKDTLEIHSALVWTLMNVQPQFVVKMLFVSIFLAAMTVDVRTDSLATPSKSAQWKMMKKEMIFARINNVAPMQFATWVNVCVHLVLQETILTTLKLVVLLYPNVLIIQTVATMKYVLSCPIQYTGNVLMPAVEPLVDLMPIV